MSHSTDPPPYTVAAATNEIIPNEQSSTSADHAILIDILDTLSKENRDLTPSKPDDWKDLASFLRRSLLLDYGVTKPRRSSDATTRLCLHFLRVYQQMQTLQRLTHKPSLPMTAAQKTAFARLFWHTVYSPARSLGVPASVVVQRVCMLGRYWEPASPAGGGHYSGCNERVLRDGGFEALAEKIVTDREVLVPVLATPGPTGERQTQELLEAIRQYQSRYFERLGPEFSQLPLDPDNAEAKDESISPYVLNANGRSYKDWRRVKAEPFTSFESLFKAVEDVTIIPTEHSSKAWWRRS